VSTGLTEPVLRQVLQDLTYAIAMGDLASLGRLWCADATLHFPSGPATGLIVGRPAVVARFERLFADFAAQRSGPPYVRFRIEEFAWVPLEPRHAAVYATLMADGRLGRRTLIVRDEPEGPRILHLHASNAGAVRGAADAE
jgi:hypothetical protein